MIKLLLLCLCIYGATCSPIQPIGYFDDIANDAEVIDSLEPLPGTRNLHEKKVPVIRLKIPAGYLGLYGTKNLGERSQLPYHYDHMMLLPGVRNLEEKAIPEAVIARITNDRYDNISYMHPKSEVEKVTV